MPEEDPQAASTIAYLRTYLAQNPGLFNTLLRKGLEFRSMITPSSPGDPPPTPTRSPPKGDIELPPPPPPGSIAALRRKTR